MKACRLTTHIVPSLPEHLHLKSIMKSIIKVTMCPTCCSSCPTHNPVFIYLAWTAQIFIPSLCESPNIKAGLISYAW